MATLSQRGQDLHGIAAELVRTQGWQKAERRNLSRGVAPEVWQGSPVNYSLRFGFNIWRMRLSKIYQRASSMGLKPEQRYYRFSSARGQYHVSSGRPERLHHHLHNTPNCLILKTNQYQMSLRMWNIQTSYRLQVGMSNRLAFLVRILAISYKIKYTLTKFLSQSTSRYLYKKNKNSLVYTDLYTNVYSTLLS